MIVKLTIVLTMIVALMIVVFLGWCKENPFKVMASEFPRWAYVLVFLVLLDVIGIFASVIWFLFFYL